MFTYKRNSYYSNKKEKKISILITLLISGSILFLILTFRTTFTTVTPPTYIDINFESGDFGSDYGTDEVGFGNEEPADQDVQKGDGGDPLANEATTTASSNETDQEDNSYLSDPSSKEAAPAVSKKTETSKNTTKKATQNNSDNSKNNNTTAKGTENKKGSGGNPKGNAALGALLSGKGSHNSSTGQGSGGRPGQNQGDPNGEGSGGGEGIGNGRNLISFIPGTMGRGGKVPVHNCSGSGTIVFSFTVDKSGNVTSVNRKSGVSNTCLVNTGIKWIKQYVKADKGKSTVSGTYRINF